MYHQRTSDGIVADLTENIISAPDVRAEQPRIVRRQILIKNQLRDHTALTSGADCREDGRSVTFGHRHNTEIRPR